MRRSILLALAALTSLSAVPATAPAQSLLGATGLGVPLAPLDARARALGGVGVGLDGPALLATDPAAAADLVIPALAFTFQTSWVDLTEAEGTGDFQGTRFPFIALSYPAGSFGTFSLGFGSVLDQRWELERQDRLVLEGTGTEALITDTFLSEGGVSAVRLGFARRVSPSLALGAQVGTHLGEVTRRFTRSFDSLEVETSVPDYQIGGRWGYSGLTATLGAIVDLGDAVRAAASYTWSEDLEAEPTEDTQGAPGLFSMPSELRAGASAYLAPTLALSAGLHWADWEGSARNRAGAGGAPADGSTGRSVLSWGAGLELAVSSLLGKPGSLRVGYRHDQLPFVTDDAPDPTDAAFTGGVGLDLVRTGNVTLAWLDLALERGTRDAGAFEESYWRLVTSFRVSGF